MLSDVETFKALAAAGVPAAVGFLTLLPLAWCLARKPAGHLQALAGAAVPVLALGCIVASWAMQFSARWDRWHFGLAAVWTLAATWAACGAVRPAGSAGGSRGRGCSVVLVLAVGACTAAACLATAVYPVLASGYRLLAWTAVPAAVAVTAAWALPLGRDDRRGVDNRRGADDRGGRPTPLDAGATGVILLACCGTAFLAGFAGAAELLAPAGVLAVVAAAAAKAAAVRVASMNSAAAKPDAPNGPQALYALCAGAVGLGTLTVPTALLAWVNSYDLGPAFAAAMVLPPAGFGLLAVGRLATPGFLQPAVPAVAVLLAWAGVALAVGQVDLRAYGL
ncbi:MAG: hypothetical protein ACFCVE_05035 [Phycisphaerae bacterium]